MPIKSKTFLLSILLVAGNAVAVSSAMAQNLSNIDPPRWTIEDRTPQARYQTSKKEAAAAYQEALNDCRQNRGADRAACLRDARTNYQRDLDEAKRRLSE
ncbi:hypothetical protein BH11PSE11_BH11PSE11_10220 [soil metagenome]